MVVHSFFFHSGDFFYGRLLIKVVQSFLFEVSHHGDAFFFLRGSV